MTACTNKCPDKLLKTSIAHGWLSSVSRCFTTQYSADFSLLSQVDGQSTDGMIMINPKDPNRPRFTLHELYQVLLERDELKLKLFLLEEDLKR